MIREDFEETKYFQNYLKKNENERISRLLRRWSDIDVDAIP